MKKNQWFWIFIFLLAFLAFWYGSRGDNPVSNVAFPPSPTPTPDPRMAMGEAVRVDGMGLSLVSAWRAPRPNDTRDLGILEVKFAGTSECNNRDEEGAHPSLCTFQRGNFQLVDGNGNRQLLSDPAMKFIPGMKYVQLAPTRDLIKLTSEQGQLYFLLDKEVNDFTLVYPSLTGGEEARMKVVPKIYGRDDAIRQLTTTPWPRREIISE